ncbi:Protein trichome birefringence-like 19 [Linum perenne]
MKLVHGHGMELKPQTLRVLILLIIIFLASTTIFPIGYYLSTGIHHVNLVSCFFSNNINSQPQPQPNGGDYGGCDIYKGEWVENTDAPYYTNTSCWAIHEHQNCIKYGRPDHGFIKWRWKPDGCELPVFNPAQFLEIVRGKSLAFVGDSVSRNQMQSLICLLSRVTYPVDVSNTADEDFKRWSYPSHNFTIASFWAPHLVKAHQEQAPNGPRHKSGLFNLYLDELNLEWTTQIHEFDYVIISAGHWFYRPAVYYENRKVVGCRFCQLDNVTDLPASYGLAKALRTSFKAINSMERYKGITFLRTFSPSHFENGEWNQGGNCNRTRPFRRKETRLDGINYELYMAQMEEYRKAEREGRKIGFKFRLMDTTQAMLLRPDGHPSRYGHFPNANVTLYNDCVHWCLPGPIDTWNDLLLHMLKLEGRKRIYFQERLHSSDRKLRFR